MRYQITITGVLDTDFDEAAIRRDFPMFVADLSRVHRDAVQDSITLVSVEALPEPEPEPESVSESTVDLSAVLSAINAVSARLDRAGL